MKKLILVTALLLMATTAQAQIYSSSGIGGQNQNSFMERQFLQQQQQYQQQQLQIQQQMLNIQQQEYNRAQFNRAQPKLYNSYQHSNYNDE
jgi:uncharacterized protein YxeA